MFKQMLKDREKTTKNLIILAILYVAIDILFATLYMHTMIGENPRMEYYDTASGSYDVGYILVRFLFALIPGTMFAVPAALAVFAIWKAVSSKSRKVRYSFVTLLVLGLIGLRFLWITDCSPHLGFFDFGRADDGVTRTCGLSTDNAWTEGGESASSR